MAQKGPSYPEKVTVMLRVCLGEDLCNSLLELVSQHRCYINSPVIMQAVRNADINDVAWKDSDIDILIPDTIATDISKFTTLLRLHGYTRTVQIDYPDIHTLYKQSIHFHHVYRNDIKIVAFKLQLKEIIESSDIIATQILYKYRIGETKTTELMRLHNDATKVSALQRLHIIMWDTSFCC
jgi:hypothetical protein